MSRPGEYYPVEEDERGTYIMNSKDLCLLPYLDEVVDCRIDSLKIEGRMKSVHYVASVVKAYRMALDACLSGNPYEVREEWRAELEKVSHRAYTTGFFFGKTTGADQIYGSSSYEQTSDFVGLVRAYDPVTQIATVEQRNNMKLGQEIEVFQPVGAPFRQNLSEMWDEEGQEIAAAPHPQQIVRMRMTQEVAANSILRRDVPIKKEERRPSLFAADDQNADYMNAVGYGALIGAPTPLVCSRPRLHPRGPVAAHRGARRPGPASSPNPRLQTSSSFRWGNDGFKLTAC